MHDLFKDSKLYMSYRSPFARRVRILLREYQIPHEEVFTDVWKLEDSYLEKSVLGRVPMLELKNGQKILDSHEIVNLLYLSHPKSPLTRSVDHPERVELSMISGVAMGVCEKVIEYFLESQKPKEVQDQEWLSEIRITTSQALQFFDSKYSERTTALSSGLSQADFDVMIAMDYFGFRYDPNWKEQAKHLARAFDQMLTNQNFLETRPS